MSTYRKPNILIFIVDQMREPQWFPNQATLDQLLPNLAKLRQNAVRFTRHYAAANMCTPSRAAMTTGLYTHQTYTCITQRTYLDPRFPTWAHLLSTFGYTSHWIGKWHLADPKQPGALVGPAALKAYGFAHCSFGDHEGDTYGKPEEGRTRDPAIANDAIAWLERAPVDEPWCTTVSFINPHDIMYAPLCTEGVIPVSGPTIPPELDLSTFLSPDQQDLYGLDTETAVHQFGIKAPPEAFLKAGQLPANFETLAQLIARNVPKLQLSLLRWSNVASGDIGDEDEAAWLTLMNRYLQLQKNVDELIGRVLEALERSENYHNTIIIFTSDHGDCCGSHGLRGKGASAYEEAIRVPFYVKDLTGQWSDGVSQDCSGLTSHIDFTPLLLTLASGGADWRADERFAHLAHRFDLSTLLRNPNNPGRTYVLHASDEISYTDEPPLYENRNIPFHLISCRTTAGKLTRYHHWLPGRDTIDPAGEEQECYDYRRKDGILELNNVASAENRVYQELTEVLNAAIVDELRKPLPGELKNVQAEAFLRYLVSVGEAPALLGSA
ncbi:MAG: sulfatase-like hydrolase/transferase [Caldilineaceae bacterium]